jgi:cell division protein FtsI (penicillin-binding protein 3)
MEVKTGKLKAIANLGRQQDGEYLEDLNYAIRGSEPGSTFKLATMISLLEDRYVKLEDHVNLEGGTWRVSNRVVYDSEKHGLTDVTVKEAFEHSSNVGMAKLVWTNYSKNPVKFVDHLKKLKLDQRSGVDLVGETNPIIKNPKSRTWSATTLPWMAFGYEVLVSPLQTLMLYNAVANDGKMMRPYLVNEVRQSGLTLSKTEPELVEESICSDRTLKLLKECLEGVVLEGTGKELNTPYYKIAGKTGTALVANGRHGYADHIYQSSFAGYFPADHPEYSCIVVIRNKPFAKKFYGAMVAGPVFREVADKLVALTSEKNEASFARSTTDFLRRDSNTFYYAGSTESLKEVLSEVKLNYKDSTDQSDWSKMYANHDQTVINKQNISSQVIPNVRGMGLKDALYLLESMDVKVKSRGKGKVISQSVNPGMPVQKNQIVTLELD